MKLSRVFALLLGSAFSLGLVAACSAAEDDDPDKLNLVTSISPITSLAENIGGTKVEIFGLVPEGSNSHTYEPPVSDVRRIADADLIIVNGLDLEDPIIRLAEANKKSGVKIVELGNATITEAEYRFDFSFPASGGRPNPHLWPNPLMALAYAEIIRDNLVELDPANQSYYDDNFAELKARLVALDQAIEEAVNSIPAQNRRLLTYHDSWAYFAARYGMSIIGAVQPSDFSEPSPRAITQIIDQIRAEGVPAIFGSEVFPSPVLEQIARETGAIFVDKLRDDNLPGEPGDELHSYLGLMVENIRNMVPALGGDASSVDSIATGLVFSDGPSGAIYPQ